MLNVPLLILNHQKIAARQWITLGAVVQTWYFSGIEFLFMCLWIGSNLMGDITEVENGEWDSSLEVEARAKRQTACSANGKAWCLKRSLTQVQWKESFCWWRYLFHNNRDYKSPVKPTKPKPNPEQSPKPGHNSRHNHESRLQLEGSLELRLLFFRQSGTKQSRFALSMRWLLSIELVETLIDNSQSLQIQHHGEKPRR